MKRCLGCMNPIHDRRESCPYCEYRQREGVKSAYYLIPGTTLKQRTYTLGKVLGCGGFGVTYIAWDNGNNKKVVIKEYVPELLSARSHGNAALKPVSADAEKQFRAGRENFIGISKMMCGNQNTENIESYYDCFEENGTAYAVMEYLNGLTLQKILENGKKFTYAQATYVIRKVLEGLVILHGQGILHMDISPTNIFLTVDDQVKILDAGSFRYTSGIFKSLSDLARNGFAAEEQYRNNGELGPWTDVYGVGAVMYQMVTGIQPPSAQQRVIEDTLVSPSEYASLPQNGETIIWNSLVISADKRIQSAEAFLHALDRKQKMEKVMVKKKRRGSKVKIAAVAAVLCVGCACAFFIIRQTGKAPLDNTVKSIKANIRIPNLDGKTVESAREEVEKLGLKLKVIEVNYSASVPKGEITGQEPENGEKAASGDTIKVKRSGGMEEIMMADLKGKTKEEAQKWLKSQNVDSETSWYEDTQDDNLYSDEQQEGTILEQSVEARQLYVIGTKSLELKVCQGKLTAKTDELEVPNLVGVSVDDAKNSILSDQNHTGEQGFTFSLADDSQITYDFSWDYDPGTITAQEPEAGTVARTNKKIQVTVARELQDTTVPDVIGSDIEEAVGVLKNAHLRTQESGQYDVVPAGQVVGLSYEDQSGEAQSADPGLRLQEKTLLSVTYSLGPKPIQKPDPIQVPVPGPTPAQNPMDNGSPENPFFE